MMKKYILAFCSFVVVVLGVYSVFWINKPNNTKPIEYIQTIAYRAMEKRCLQDGYSSDKCSTIMIRGVYGRANGETPDPDGYVFDFSNTYRSAQDTIVYRVIVFNDGTIVSVEPIDKSTLNNITE